MNNRQSIKKQINISEKKNDSVSAAKLITAATCALLAATSVQSLAAEDKGWQVDSAVLLYQEKDRVEAVEPAIRATKKFDNDSILNLKVVVDTLTGASPSGATATDKPVTYTRPSGNGSYITPAGEIPLDDTFKDTRTQLSVGYDAPLGDTSRYSVGLNVSSEFDYESMGISGSWQKDFNQRNTTFMLGLAYASDTIKPKGGIPTPFASMQPAGIDPVREGTDDSKQVTDFIIGLTQVINRNTLMQFNYSYGQSSGYLNDPFKIVSVIDSVTGDTLDNIYEARPEDRTKQSLFWKTKYHTPWSDTVDFSVRLMSDDWGIDSTTLDFKYRWNISPKWYVEPHVRLYSQTSADFYVHSLPDNGPTTAYLSADYRLAEFDATTYGAKVGYKLSERAEFNIRAELYEQTGDSNPGDAIGLQRQQDLYPDLEATILQFGYTFRW